MQPGRGVTRFSLHLSSVLARQAAPVALLAVFMRDSAPSESRKRMAQSL